MVSMGLPVGEDSDESTKQFREHFVGSLYRNKRLRGMTPHLSFNSIDRAGQMHITVYGLKFARLENPILDGSLDADATLSTGERNFVLDHLEQNIGNEYRSMEHVARSIDDGIDSPEKLTHVLTDITPSNWTMTDSVAESMRNGIVSRMTELDLIEPVREDEDITYKVTESGTDLL